MWKIILFFTFILNLNINVSALECFQCSSPEECGTVDDETETQECEGGTDVCVEYVLKHQEGVESSNTKVRKCGKIDFCQTLFEEEGSGNVEIRCHVCASDNCNDGNLNSVVRLKREKKWNWKRDKHHGDSKDWKKDKHDGDDCDKDEHHDDWKKDKHDKDWKKDDDKHWKKDKHDKDWKKDRHDKDWNKDDDKHWKKDKHDKDWKKDKHDKDWKDWKKDDDKDWKKDKHDKDWRKDKHGKDWKDWKKDDDKDWEKDKHDKDWKKDDHDEDWKKGKHSNGW